MNERMKIPAGVVAFALCCLWLAALLGAMIGGLDFNGLM